MSIERSVAKIAKTATITIAALVTVPAVWRIPVEPRHPPCLMPLSRSSLMRLRMKTW